MKYYRDVILPEVGSEKIEYFELQKPFVLQEKFVHNGKTIQPIKYVADFFVHYSDGNEIVIDTKGCPDSVAKIKRKLFWYRFPDIEYKWISYSKMDGGWIEYEELEKKRKERKRNKSII